MNFTSATQIPQRTVVLGVYTAGESRTGAFTLTKVSRGWPLWIGAVVDVNGDGNVSTGPELGDPPVESIGWYSNIDDHPARMEFDGDQNVCTILVHDPGDFEKNVFLGLCGSLTFPGCRSRIEHAAESRPEG